jgi:CPA1 family monovalent cation:H+ antiporter
LFFVFNGALFIILGLQLRSIFRELEIFPAATLAEYALAITGTVIAVRMIWVYGGWSLSRRRSPTWAFVLGWSGMRGIVSLAAALAIPNDVAAGAPFPARDLILFITFAVILVTLLGQGLTLPWFIKRLGVIEPDAGERPRALARMRVAEAALGRLVELEASFISTAHWEVAGRLRARYEEQLQHFGAFIDGAGEDGDAVQHDLERELIRHTIEAERAALDDMRHAGEIGDQVFRRMQYDIDLAESRLLVD